MKRQRRNRSTRRRGLQHVGDVLSAILTDIEPDEQPGSSATQTVPEQDGASLPLTVAATGSQHTFSFYQTADA